MNSGLPGVALPKLTELQHPIIQSLANLSDQALVALFEQHHRQKGQYFTAIYCRYAHLVFVLIKNPQRSPLQSEYLFTKTWQHLYQALKGPRVKAMPISPNSSLQSWIVRNAALGTQEAELPLIAYSRYSLPAAPPPLWCYLHAALDCLPASQRLMILMAKTFHWSETRISAYLQAEGELLSPAEVRVKLQAGYQQLETSLPEDIRAIYLEPASTPPGG